MIGVSDVTAVAPRTGTWAPRRRRTLGAALLEALAVLGTSLRLLLRHWPVLFALYFAGAAAREFVVLGAVQVSKINGVLGLLVVVLGPIATLTALVLMLRALRPSLPWLAAATTEPEASGATEPTDPATAEPAGDGGHRPPRRRTLLDHLGSALVPFLAVYASWGYLQEDFTDYFYQLFVDIYLSDAAIFIDPGQVAENAERRMPLDITGTIVAVVAVAVVLRWLLGRWQERSRMGWLGIPGAYVEVIWISVVAATVAQAQDPLLQWLQERRVVGWLLDSWHGLVDRLGPLSGPVRATSEFLLNAAGSVQVAVVVPLAWLAVGAVVYGHRLTPPPPSEADLVERAARRWRALPRPVRVVGANLGADLRERFAPMVHSLRLMVRAGLAPMLFFCLAFLLAQSAREWLWEAERLIIGGQDLESVWMPLSGRLTMLNDAVGTVLLACLLGAAVDRVLRIQPPPTSATEESATEESVTEPSAAGPSAAEAFGTEAFAAGTSATGSPAGSGQPGGGPGDQPTGSRA
ncbi:hypothetical protein C6361_15895 [Plantactinospora sp. BC1]|uniref:hypothetical protein n=1 Tax=Plantactinospora sp. BC1 TaxID=2108470 RepID=UPI000D166B63|nr:hypothetical protein [Plantactinospora sp. BC1]AVT30712.1 hypothetical protein C6361_15895 [Plantactinospora sp. BC1]